MNIVVIGAGYVGLVTSACFAELGNFVTCLDVDKAKISDLVKGQLPIYEPGLLAMIESNIKQKRLHFVSSFKEIPEEAHVIFIAVGTPSKIDGSANMQYVLQVAHEIGEHIHYDCIIVDKSTVPVGGTEEVKKIICDEWKKRNVMKRCEIVSNPEFLREGAAIDDFMKPDRIIIGVAESKAKTIMSELYLPIVRNPEKIFFMSIEEAEMTKYVANAMLATRISFMNEMAVLCERMGVDIEKVRLGIGSDSRIGQAFIYPGCGYGGSCFPKDVKALISMATKHNIDPFILKAVEQRNHHQKRLLSDKIFGLFGDDLTNHTIGVWGLSFKPGTDDIREASSLILLEKLIEHHAMVKVYDPVAMPAAKQLFPKEWITSGKLHFAEQEYDVLKGADVLVLVTEWQSFCYPDLARMKKMMRHPIILDGRNQYNPAQLKEAGFQYYGIGR